MPVSVSVPGDRARGGRRHHGVPAGTGACGLRTPVGAPAAPRRGAGGHELVAGVGADPRPPGGQGGGLGRRLVLGALDAARRRGARSVTLRVLEPNVRARRLYEACGFVVEGVLREEFWLQGRYVDDLLMRCELTGP